ncbi:hypothetical protein OHV05_04345 [Kitasatospora sp. NBC_00070]|uniref:phage tail tube protein n=1 Tax=Kitasatospora sp. NBC_00070 TaxID=2975962 RepID=UPI0032454782
MPISDTAVIVPAGGYLYTAPPDEPKPTTITNPLSPGAKWVSVGHTSLDELPEFSRDGDDPETKGSWQNTRLRQTNPSVAYSISFKSIQADAETYRLYFGAGTDAVQADGSFRIPASPVPQVRSVLLILVDGTRFLPLWHPRVSLLGSDAISMASDDFVSFPIKGTLLGSTLIGNAVGEWGVLV